MTKRLRRSADNKMIGGVCAGVADYFAIDPVIVRVIAFVLLAFDGLGLVLYIIGWIVMPVATAGQERSHGSSQGAQSGVWMKYIPGVVLISIGFYLLADQYLYIGDFEGFWPVLLILIGVGVIMKSLRKKSRVQADKMQTESNHANNGESLA